MYQPSSCEITPLSVSTKKKHSVILKTSRNSKNGHHLVKLKHHQVTIVRTGDNSRHQHVKANTEVLHKRNYGGTQAEHRVVHHPSDIPPHRVLLFQTEQRPHPAERSHLPT